MKPRLERLAIFFAALLFGAASVNAQSRIGTATVEFTKPTFFVSENAGRATVVIKRSGNLSGDIDVVFSATGGTAREGVNFTAKNGPVTIAAGRTEERLQIPILHDASLQGSRSVKLALSDPSGGAALGTLSVAELVIEESDTGTTAWLHFGLDRLEALQRPFFEIPLWQYLASFIYIFFAFCVAKVIDFLIHGQLRQWARRTRTKFDDLLLELVRGPVKIIAFVILLHLGLRVFTWPSWFAGFLTKTLHVIVALSLTYMALKFVDLAMGLWRQRANADESTAAQLLPLIRNTLKVFVVVVAVLLTLQNLGLNITSLIASLSIAGLAVSLAAQDTLSNLFGAVAVLSDKPFRVGDRIKIDTVEGHVESVGLRSTRVRSLEGHLVSIPNKVINNATITQIVTPPAGQK